MRIIIIFAFVLLSAPLIASAQTTQGTAFTYQGQLLQNNAPVTGNTAMTFTLWDSASGGNLIGTEIFDGVGSDPAPVSVFNGIFTVTLDFGGSAFFTIGDDARWLQVAVGTTVLSPRTAIENAPYALTSQLAYNVPAGSIGTTQIIPAQVQSRVTGTCSSGAISTINQNGSVVCQTGGSGTITGVTPASGSGLTGGGTSGGVSMGTDFNVLQKRIGSACASGSSISAVNADGSVACQVAGTGTLTSVTAGFGLAGGTITGSGTIDVDTNVIATKSNTWGLIGNTGVGTGFLGTSDNNALTFKVNGTTAGQLQPTAPSGGFSDEPNVIFGSSANTVAAGVVGATIGGGGARYTSGNFNHSVSGSYGTISGGTSNTAGSGAFVGGGNANSANGTYSAVGGGQLNFADGSGAMVPGGYGNKAEGSASFAAGSFARVRSAADTGGIADSGTFVWSDSSGSPSNLFMSSGVNQFLVRAGGGVGINTTPYIPDVELTIKGSATAPSANADIVMLPRNSNYGFNLSVSGTMQSDAAFAIETTQGFTPVFGIDASGNATVNQGNLTLAGTTAQAYKPGGGSWSIPSDARLKRDVRPLDHVLDNLLQLHGVTFEYANPDAGLHPAGRHTGFIAQEVQQVFPDWVGQTPDGYLSVGPQGFEAMTVEALRELRAEKDAEIADLRARLERLETRLEAQP